MTQNPTVTLSYYANLSLFYPINGEHQDKEHQAYTFLSHRYNQMEFELQTLYGILHSTDCVAIRQRGIRVTNVFPLSKDSDINGYLHHVSL